MRIDYSMPGSFHNWVDPNKLDLTCVDRKLQGSMGSMFFLGFAISCAIVPYIADLYGRKKPVFWSMFVQTIAWIVIVLSTNIYTINAMFLVVGLCGGGRVATGTMYMNEYVPSRWNTFVTTSLNCYDACIMIFVSLYFMVMPYWIPQAVFGIAFSILMLVCLLFIPESPKYFYARDRFQEAK